MLIAERIQKTYPTRSDPLTVLRDASLQLAPGQSAAIVGPSGSGKSTLLSILGTLETPTAGRVELAGVNPFELAPAALAEFRNQRVGFVFQDHHLLPQCSALENVLLPALARKRAGCAVERARDLLRRVGLEHRSEHRPAELSGGEKQRVALARALINQPALLLADEPTGNLDRVTADVVAELLLSLHREAQTILLVVTHSAPLARRFERCLEIVNGVLQPVAAGALT